MAKYLRMTVILLKTCLLTICKAFARPHLEYADIIYDKPDNESFKDWLEKIQYNAALAITEAIWGTLRKHICNKLGQEYLADRRWFRKITFFCKIIENIAPKYLQSYLLPQTLNQYSSRSAKKNLLIVLSSRTLSFSNTMPTYNEASAYSPTGLLINNTNVHTWTLKSYILSKFSETEKI